LHLFLHALKDLLIFKLLSVHQRRTREAQAVQFGAMVEVKVLH
jgi:hypothetical protein